MIKFLQYGFLISLIIFFNDYSMEEMEELDPNKMLYGAIESRKIEDIVDAFNLGADVNYVDHVDGSFLFFALKNKASLEMIKILLRKGCDPRLGNPNFQRDCLNHKNIEESIELKSLLDNQMKEIKENEDRSFNSVKSLFQLAALMVIANCRRFQEERGYKYQLKELPEEIKFKLDEIQEVNWKKLILAIQIDNVKLAEFAVNSGAYLKKLFMKWNPLALAMHYRRFDIVFLLISVDGYVNDSLNAAVLYYSRNKKNRDCLDLLLSKNLKLSISWYSSFASMLSDSENEEEKKQLNEFRLNYFRQLVKDIPSLQILTIQAFLKKEYDHSKLKSFCREKDIIASAKKRFYPDMMSVGLEYEDMDIISYAIIYGANPNKRFRLNNSYRSPLQWARATKNSELEKFLIEQGASDF